MNCSRKFKYITILCFCFLLFLSACNKNKKIPRDEQTLTIPMPTIVAEITKGEEPSDVVVPSIAVKPTIDVKPTITATPTITVKPTITATPSITEPAKQPMLTAVPTLAIEDEGTSLLTFKVEPITVPKDMKIPYMSKEEFPVMDGSTANIPLGEALYSYLTGASEEEAREDVVFYKTSDSYRRLLNEEADILLVYEPSQTILAELKEANAEFDFKPLGRDALVFIANEGNPINSLSRQEIVDIYTGTVTNWAELGGADVEILPFQRPADSGSQTLMEKLAVSADIIMKGPTVLTPAEMGSLIDELASYNNKSNALGYSVYFYAKNMYTKPGLKFIAIDDVMPINESIQKGDYPYVNDFYVVIRKNEKVGSNSRILYEWLTTKEAQKLVVKAGYVPVVDVSDSQVSEEQATSIYKNPPLNIGETDYIVVHDTSSKDGIVGDILLNRNLEPVLSFQGKQIVTNKNLLFTESDIVILEGAIDSGSENERERYNYSGYEYELYNLKTKSYVTRRRYTTVEESEYGLFHLENSRYSLNFYYEGVYNAKGKLIFEDSYMGGSKDYSIVMVKNHVLRYKNKTLTVINNEGAILSTQKLEYDGYLTQDWRRGNERSTDYACIRTDTGAYIILDENGNIKSDKSFLKNVTFKYDKTYSWITTVGQSEDGTLIVAGYLSGHYIVVKEDGTILFNQEAKKDEYYSNINSGVIEVINKESWISYYLTVQGKMIGNEKDQQISIMNDSIVLIQKDGFIVYNLYRLENYKISSKDYLTDYFTMTEYRTIPEFFEYKTSDKNGESQDFSYYKDIKKFKGYVSAKRVEDKYYIVWNEGIDLVMDTKGKIIYEGKENERILDLILGKDLYVSVKSGNYSGIKDMKGNYVYRQYAPHLSDD